METMFAICIYLFVGSLVVMYKNKEIEALVGIISVHNNSKCIHYYLMLFFAKIILVVLFPLALLLK